MEVIDCVLLVNFYAGPDWTALMTGLTQAQINAKKTAINGHLDQHWLPVVEQRVRLQQQAGQLRADAGRSTRRPGAMAPVGAPRNNCRLPAALVYDPVTNPNGTRCGDPDLAAAVWGTTAGVSPAASARCRRSTTSAFSTG